MCLGLVSVKGDNLFPAPAARITALLTTIKFSSRFEAQYSNIDSPLFTFYYNENNNGQISEKVNQFRENKPYFLLNYVMINEIVETQ